MIHANASRLWRRIATDASRRVTNTVGVTLDQNRSASLLVRVWLEGGTEGFRARLTSVDTSLGSDEGGELTADVASSPTDVIILVQAWLTAFLGPDVESGAGPS